MKIDDQMIDKISGLAYLEFGEEEKEKIRQDLLVYCRLDTLAMVRIWEKLVSLTRPRGQMSLF